MTTVDVVIPYSPAHTSQKQLSRAVESIKKQEVETNILRIVDEEQNGPAWARNQGLNQSSNRYIAFCDADDYWITGKLSAQLRRIRNSDAGICITQTTDTEQQQQFVSEFNTTSEFVKNVFLGESKSFTSSILLDTEKVNSRFDEKIYRREDHLYSFEAAACGDACFVDTPFVVIDKHDSGLSANENRQEIIRAQENFYERAVELFPFLSDYEFHFWSEVYHSAGRHYYFKGQYCVSIKHFKRSLSEKYRLKTGASLLLSYYALMRQFVNY